MSFFAILFALLLEQARPLNPVNWVHSSVRSWVQMVAKNFDAGKQQHGWLAWSITVAVPSLVVLAVHGFLVMTSSWILAMAWSVVVLYITLGFRQFSHHFTDIRDALDAGDEARARDLLAAWQQIDAAELPPSEIVRHVIEYSVLAAHRHVFGVLAGYTLLAALGLGPTGAVAYRLSEFVARYWRQLDKDAGVSELAHDAAVTAWQLIDWLPARITALGFAVVGSFEEAIDSWRQYGQNTESNNDGVILAATSGAINVRLSSATVEPDEDPEAPSTLTAAPSQEPLVSHLRSIVGLVWRSVVLWMLLLALLTLARLMG